MSLSNWKKLKGNAWEHKTNGSVVSFGQVGVDVNNGRTTNVYASGVTVRSNPKSGGTHKWLAMRVSRAKALQSAKAYMRRH